MVTVVAPDIEEVQRDVVALTTALRACDLVALCAVLDPYFAALDPEASAPLASLLTSFARQLGDAYEHIACAEGVTFEHFIQVAGIQSL